MSKQESVNLDTLGPEYKAFAEAMKHNSSRLVVQCGVAPDGSEQFMWGTVGKAIPILSVIGYIGRVQYELQSAEIWVPKCPIKALVIAWNDENKELSCYVDHSINVDALSGMLEVIKTTLVGSRLGQHQAAQMVATPRLLGPDGQIMRH